MKFIGLYIFFVLVIVIYYGINKVNKYDNDIKTFYNNINKTSLIPNHLQNHNKSCFIILEDSTLEGLIPKIYKGTFYYSNNIFYFHQQGIIINNNKTLEIISDKNNLISYDYDYLVNIITQCICIICLLYVIPFYVYLYNHTSISRKTSCELMFFIFIFMFYGLYSTFRLRDSFINENIGFNNKFILT